VIYVIFGFIWLGPSGSSAMLDFPEDIHLKKYGAWIKPVYITDNPGKRRSKRRTFDIDPMNKKLSVYLPNQDDEKAKRIAEAFLGCLFILHGYLPLAENIFVYSVSDEYLIEGKYIPETAFGENDYYLLNIGTHSAIRYYDYKEAGRLVDATVDDDLFMAVTFYEAGARLLFVSPIDMNDYGRDRNWKPETAEERTTMESAFLNFYKSIEAIFGDPNKDRKVFAEKLKAQGVDPEELVEFREKERIIDKIYKMSRIRDKKVAHGKSMPHTKRSISYYEFMDFQYLANYLICTVLNKRLEKNMNDENDMDD